MDGRRRASEVEDLINLNEEGMSDVMAQELEVLVVEKVLDIAPRAGEKIVHAQNLLSSRQQLLAEVGPRSRHQDPLLKMHMDSPA